MRICHAISGQASPTTEYWACNIFNPRITFFILERCWKTNGSHHLNFTMNSYNLTLYRLIRASVSPSEVERAELGWWTLSVFLFCFFESIYILGCKISRGPGYIEAGLPKRLDLIKPPLRLNLPTSNAPFLDLYPELPFLQYDQTCYYCKVDTMCCMHNA